MFATGLIVFRETLEAALFVGIVAASTRGLPGRGLWLAGGVGAGFVGSLLMAAGMGQISAWADGLGQDMLNVLIISVALLMLAWHCIWVSTHGKEMAQGAKALGHAAASGDSSLWALSLAVGLSVLREGAETVLFVAGFVSGAPEGQGSLWLSAGLGLAAGAAAGWLVYGGLARIRAQHLFTVTNTMILVLAGSLASQLAKTLIQAGLVQHWTEPLWDASFLIANDAPLGVLLHALLGYDATPSGLQLTFYVGAMVLISLAARLARLYHAPAARTSVAV
jgi:high-affinity iron transporter